HRAARAPSRAAGPHRQRLLRESLPRQAADARAARRVCEDGALMAARISTGNGREIQQPRHRHWGACRRGRDWAQLRTVDAAGGFRAARNAGTVYGLGCGVRDSLDGVSGRFLTHGGSNGYWYARIVLAPDQENGLLIVANSASDAAQKAITEVETKVVPTLVK